MSATPPSRAPRRGPQRWFRVPSYGWASVRDFVSWAAGMAIIAHEVWWEQYVEVYAVLIGMVLAGLPLILPSGERPPPPEVTDSGSDRTRH